MESKDAYVIGLYKISQKAKLKSEHTLKKTSVFNDCTFSKTASAFWDFAFRPHRRLWPSNSIFSTQDKSLSCILKENTVKGQASAKILESTPEVPYCALLSTTAERKTVKSTYFRRATIWNYELYSKI